MGIPSTTERVTAHTDAATDRRIMKEMEYRLAYYLDRPEEIAERLRELDREWDMERKLEANASTLALAGVLLSATVSRKLLLIPAVVTGFLLQHAIQGWCPPVPVLRHFGTRTQGEIELERYALKALRGDFGALSKEGEPSGTSRDRDRPGTVLDALRKVA